MTARFFPSEVGVNNVQTSHEQGNKNWRTEADSPFNGGRGEN